MDRSRYLFLDGGVIRSMPGTAAQRSELCEDRATVTGVAMKIFSGCADVLLSSSLIDGGTKTLEQGRNGEVQGIPGGGGDEFSGWEQSTGALNDCSVAEGLRSCQGVSTIILKVCGLLMSCRSKRMPYVNVAHCS